MTGACRQCGYCCSFMGEIFGIAEQTGRYEFRIRYLPTGVEQAVRIDPDKQDLFERSSMHDTRPLACPFLRERGDGCCVCTIHQTRPDLCRMYLCDRQQRP